MDPMAVIIHSLMVLLTITVAMADPETPRDRRSMVTVHTVVIQKVKWSTMLRLWRNSRHRKWHEWRRKRRIIIMMMTMVKDMVTDMVMDTVMDTAMDMATDAITVVVEDTNLF